MPRLFIALFFLAFSSVTASAQQFVFGLGQDEVFDSGQGSEAIVLEYHGAPIWTRNAFDVSLGAAIETDGDGDFWIGAGLAATYGLSDKWYIEGSFMPGYFDQGTNGTNLGHDIEFRSLVGLGYRITDRSSLSLAISHLSNAGISDTNPGTETIALRFTFR